MCRTTDRARKTAAKRNLIGIKPKIPFQSYLDIVYDRVRPTLGPDLGDDRTRLAISIFLRGTGTAYEYCWQNLTSRVKTDGLVDLLNKSISGFVKQVSLTSPELG